jgi:hypothetical protein
MWFTEIGQQKDSVSQCASVIDPRPGVTEEEQQQARNMSDSSPKRINLLDVPTLIAERLYAKPVAKNQV